MPKPSVTIDYQLCDPKQCNDGVCQAMLACTHNIIKQEAPYEMPDYYPNMCQSCRDCVTVCPTKAIQIG